VESVDVILGQAEAHDDAHGGTGTLASAGIRRKPCTLQLTMNYREDMTIFVQTKSDESFTCNVLPTDTILHVKKMIETQEGICPNHQRLVYNGKHLDNARTLNYYRIAHNTSLYLDLRLRDGMQIFVRGLTGETITLNVEPSDTSTTSSSCYKTGWVYLRHIND
jgi:hypothetical protein